MSNTYKILLGLIILNFLFGCAEKPTQKPLQKDYPITPVPFTQVMIKDNFWQPRLETNRKVTVPYTFAKSEETGRISNFAKAGGLEEGPFEGIFFNDSDGAKVKNYVYTTIVILVFRKHYFNLIVEDVLKGFSFSNEMGFALMP